MGSDRRRILFLAEGATMAHFVRPLVLAGALDAREFEVHFHAPARFLHLLVGKGFASGELGTMAPERFLENISRGAPVFPPDVIRAYVREDRELIARIRPDLVVGDMRPSLPISGRLEGVKCAVIINAYWSPYAVRRSIPPAIPLTRLVPPRLLGPLYRFVEPVAHSIHVGQMNRVRREFGLAPLAPDLRVAYTEGDYVLYPDLPEMIPVKGCPTSHYFVGACDWNPPQPAPVWWSRMLEDPKPKVFVALGSSGQLRILPALFEALARLPVSILLATSGRSLPEAAATQYLAHLLPLRETAAAASVVVSHGGSSGTYPAMGAGTPVLAVPANADQQLSAAVLEESGAGLKVRTEEASAKRLKAALERLLFDKRYRDAARRWSEVFRKYDSPARFREFLSRAPG